MSERGEAGISPSMETQAEPTEGEAQPKSTRSRERGPSGPAPVGRRKRK